MTKEEMIGLVGTIKNPIKQKKLIFQLANELGLKFKPTNCGKCLKDYVNILKEELGLINNASEESDFNEEHTDIPNVEEGPKNEWIYAVDRPVVWNGHLIDDNTPEDVKMAFIQRFPTGYFKKVEKQPETINNEE